MLFPSGGFRNSKLTHLLQDSLGMYISCVRFKSSKDPVSAEIDGNIPCLFVVKRCRR